jgi:hypothetical protein
MREVKLGNFEEFISSHAAHLPLPGNGGRLSRWHYRALYRGQSSASYALSTTLERYGQSNCSVKRYAEYVCSCSAEYDSYLGSKHMIVPDNEKWRTWEMLIKDEAFLKLAVRLRHFGFPSPLLDWTRSPYIAAYFAYADAVPDGNVAILAFTEMTDSGKSWKRDAPRIQSIGPNIATHERHHIQQTEYTVCTQLDGDGEVFACHEKVVLLNNTEQDILVKFIMQGGERDRVLDHLAAMNINAYTPFRDEAGLCRFLAQKHFRRRDA